MKMPAWVLWCALALVPAVVPAIAHAEVTPVSGAAAEVEAAGVDAENGAALAIVAAPETSGPTTGASASDPAGSNGASADDAVDPLESFNRKVFIFNGVVDHFLIKPVAEVYEAVVPRPVRQGVGNVVGNISDAWSVVNLVLQGKPAKALEMTLRVGVNTVFGLAGLIDLSTEAGLERQSEDFGQTLAAWGVPSGAYLVLPVFGPSTLRDAAAMPLDRAAIGLAKPTGEAQRWRWVGLQLTHGRAEVLPFTRMLDTVALDKYTFVRDAYLARRRSQLYDGSPPEPASD